MMQILITDPCDEVLTEGLRKQGNTVHYLPGISLEDIDKKIHEYDGIIINTRVVMYKDRIDKAVRLKFIARMGSGLDIIDLNYASIKNIHVISSPEGNALAVAEHVLAMMLSLLAKIKVGGEIVRQSVWDREAGRGVELSGKTIGIIGYGNNGFAFSRLLAGFDVNILVYDKYKEVNDEKLYRAKIQRSSLEKLIATSDIISFHIPLTTETANWIDHAFIDKCKKGCILINTSRGKVANLDAIIMGLTSGKLSGCGLDVFPNEKPSTFSDVEKMQLDTLANMSQVLLTPHVAGWTKESRIKIAEVLLEKITYLNYK